LRALGPKIAHRRSD